MEGKRQENTGKRANKQLMNESILNALAFRKIWK